MPRLLIGVPSYAAPVAFLRRQAIRRLSGSNASSSSETSLVFVLADDAQGAEDGSGAGSRRRQLSGIHNARASGKLAHRTRGRARMHWQCAPGPGAARRAAIRPAMHAPGAASQTAAYTTSA